jgi:hypothetical protein
LTFTQCRERIAGLQGTWNRKYPVSIPQVGGLNGRIIKLYTFSEVSVFNKLATEHCATDKDYAVPSCI